MDTSITIVNISINRFILLYLFIGFVLLIYNYLKLSIFKDLLIAVCRMTVQLIIAGFILLYIFDINSFWLVILVFTFMSCFATHTILRRAHMRIPKYFFKIFIPVFLNGLFMSFFFLYIIVHPEPWYDARYFIPITGMALGNSMNACALAIDRFLDSIKNNLKEIETILVLGGTQYESIKKFYSNSIKSACIPIITNMSGIGLVFLPGLLTGQILSGVNPLIAIKYQIAIMIIIVSSITFTSIFTLFVTFKSIFDTRDRLKYELID
ncbi:MAG: iron export ABC transporter permease subunit FetB [Deferribacterota bacterium]|nr:iron export ABC transporter permease subunit FetB [Deferribacterota bacterium]